jgi:hypothetical protein
MLTKTFLCLLACIALMLATGVRAADPLDKSGSFVPSVSFSESHTESVTGAAGSREVAISQSASATIVANITGIVLANIDTTTDFALNFGGASISFVLGDIPTYTKGQTTAFYCWKGWSTANKALGTGGVKLTWTTTKLTVTITMGNEETRPGAIAADGFLGAVDPDTGAAISLKDTLDVDVKFGPIASTQRRVYFTGTSSVKHVSYSATDEEFDLNTVTLSGSSEYTSPTISLVSPSQGASVGAVVTITGKASDSRGLDKVQWSPNPITSNSWQDVVNTIITPPANGLWGTTTATWSLALTGLPHGITKIWVKAIDESRNESAPLAISVVNPLLTPLPGRWDAALTPTINAGALRGSLYFTFSVKGSCTGQLTLEGTTYPLSGGLLGDESLSITIKRAATLGNILITGTLGSFAPGTSAAGVLNGNVSINSVSVATFVARRSPFSSTVLADASLAGRFHLITSRPTTPYGYGYLIATTARAGSASISGKLPDGTAITWSGYLGANGALPVFVRLYGNKGSLSGTPIIDGNTRAVAATAMKWVRPLAVSDKQFPSGFDLDLTVSGAAYVYTSSVRVMGLGATLPNARATLLADAMATPTTVDFSVDVANKATVPTNPDQLKLTLTASTGLWTGTFKASGSSTLANCYLLISGNTAYGFYIAPAVSPSVAKRFGTVTIAAP